MHVDIQGMDPGIHYHSLIADFQVLFKSQSKGGKFFIPHRTATTHHAEKENDAAAFLRNAARFVHDPPCRGDPVWPGILPNLIQCAQDSSIS